MLVMILVQTTYVFRVRIVSQVAIKYEMRGPGAAPLEINGR